MGLPADLINMLALQTAELALDSRSAGCGRFNNARPDHFKMYVLHKMKKRGHVSLTYLTQACPTIRAAHSLSPSLLGGWTLGSG